MIFTDEEDRTLRRLCQCIIDRPLAMNQQKADIWDDTIHYCDDWHAIEILKYLFNGEEMYLNDPPPHRLRRSDAKNYKEKIVTEGRAKLKLFDALRRRTVGNDGIVVFKADCGIDALLALLARDWTWMYICEPNEAKRSRMARFFTNENITFSDATSRKQYGPLKEATVLINDMDKNDDINALIINNGEIV